MLRRLGCNVLVDRSAFIFITVVKRNIIYDNQLYSVQRNKNGIIKQNFDKIKNPTPSAFLDLWLSPSYWIGVYSF